MATKAYLSLEEGNVVVFHEFISLPFMNLILLLGWHSRETVFRFSTFVLQVFFFCIRFCHLDKNKTKKNLTTGSLFAFSFKEMGKNTLHIYLIHKIFLLRLYDMYSFPESSVLCIQSVILLFGSLQLHHICKKIVDVFHFGSFAFPF